MGLGRGPDRFLLGGEVLLGQLGDPIADPDALHRIRAAAVSEPRISYRVVMPTRAIPVG